MVHIIVCGHGHVADGLLSGLKMLSGKALHCEAVNFTEGMSAEMLAIALSRAAQNAKEMPLLFLVDVMSSTPYRTAVMIANQRPNSAVVTGVNLHMLLEAVIERDAVESLSELTDDLVQSTQGGVICHTSQCYSSAVSA